MSKTVTVAVTGAAGQIGYALLPSLATCRTFAPGTKIALRLLEIPPMMGDLEGVVMELYDCNLPMLESIEITDNPEVAFEGANWALLIGSKPRGRGMKRSDLIRINGPIFQMQGKALAKTAASDVKVLVVGNPANTNAMIAQHNAKDIPAKRFAALTRLDENRAYAQLALKAGVPVTDVKNVTIWGNHSATQYPDAENATINDIPVPEIITDTEWLRGEFISTVQNRGAEIIAARGKSSAASAANGVLDHMRCFESETPQGRWFSAGVTSDGSYGIDKGLNFSFPLTCKGGGDYRIMQNLPLSDFAKEKIAITHDELREAKKIVEDLL